MLGRTLLISGGTIQREFARRYLQEHHFDTVVCADSGLDSAYHIGVPVSYFMGDFDSVSPEILEQYRQGRIENSVRAEWIQYPKRKDATDTHMVIDWIVERGADELVIFGATGGRLDHFLANVSLLMIPLRRGIDAYIVDECNRIYLTDRDIVLYRRRLFGKYISLHPLTSEVTGVTLHGFQYPLQKDTLTIGSSWGISNEMVQGVQEAQIQLERGVLIVIESRDVPEGCE